MRAIQSKHVLIVDDEPAVAMMISASLEKLGREYIVEIAYSGNDALAKLQQTAYALLITDYSMPGMTGLDLAQAVRKVSPQTQVVLMTAFGTDKLRRTIGNVDFDGYLDKPFTLTQIREIVERAIERTQNQTKPDPDKSTLDELANQHLKSLRANTGAYCVLLISSNGYPIDAVGQAKHLDVSSVSALVAANFLAASELANLLGSDTSMFKSSYYEGNDYNIYSYKINEELLLAVVFGSASKPGVVWFYTKQAATELEPLLAAQTSQFTFAEDDMEAALDTGFNELFGDADLV